MAEPMVRCLMVTTGMEDTVAKVIAARGLGEGMTPRRVRVRKIRGTWLEDRLSLLPGYLFVYADREIPVREYQKLEHVLKVLRYDREPDGYLKGNDLEFALTVQELDGKLDVLDAVDEDGFIRITDHLLQRMGGVVESVNKGKRQVRIRTSLLGQERTIIMNYELLPEGAEQEGEDMR